MCAPEIGPSKVMRTKRIAPVATVLASSATASLPRDKFSAMIPEPITVANRKNEPTPSAASLRPRGGRSDKVSHAADLAQPAPEEPPRYGFRGATQAGHP